MALVTRPLQKASVVDMHLTKLAQGFNSGERIAERVFPKLVVDKVSGRYIVWNAGAFKYKSTLRALGARAQRTDYDYDLQSFTLPDGHTSEFSVDDREDAQTAGISNLNLPKQKMFLKQGEMATEKEVEAAIVATTPGNFNNKGNVTYAGIAGSGADAGKFGWGRSDAPIFDDVETAKELVCDKIGIYPNIMVISRKVWRAMRRNTSLQKYFINTTPGAAALTLKIVADLLELDEIIVGKATYTDDASNRVDIWGAATAVLIYRGEPQGDQAVDPSSAPPSFGWLLQLQGYPKVIKYRDEAATSMVGAVHDNWKVLQTSQDAGYLFQSVLS